MIMGVCYLPTINSHKLLYIFDWDRTHFTIFCDSRSALQSIIHYDSTHPLINRIITQTIKLNQKGKLICLCWCPAHVGIPGNEAADRLATRSISENLTIANESLPYRDWFPVIKAKTRLSWYDDWGNIQGNKLRMILATPEKPNSHKISNKLHSIICTRLRIGHTKLTHQYLMERREQPYCEDCIVPLTVRHALTECPSFNDIRLRIYPHILNMDPEEILKTMLTGPPGNHQDLTYLLQYLAETNLLDKIV